MRVTKSPSGVPLWKVSIRIAPEAEDAFTEMLARVFGQPASVYADVEQGTTVASIYLPRFTPRQRAELHEALASIRDAGLDFGSGRVSVRRIPRENWAESWKRHFKPLEISSRLLIIPSWSKCQPKRGQAVVVLDPGLSFGTGHHPTTAFCLEQIAARRVAGNRQPFLDIGSGSGILSIAAAKLGYSPVVAFDFDPDAVRVAKENAAANGVKISLSQQDLTRLPARGREKFTVVCANLIYDLLIQERRRILNRLAPGGTLVLAGILKEQFARVRDAYQAMGLRLAAVEERASGVQARFALERDRDLARVVKAGHVDPATVWQKLCKNRFEQLAGECNLFTQVAPDDACQWQELIGSGGKMPLARRPLEAA